MATPKTPFRAYRHMSISEYASASCRNEECLWARGRSKETLTAVKAHCAETGHIVDMIQSTVSVYKGEPR
jgi:hypothetical protein